MGKGGDGEEEEGEGEGEEEKEGGGRKRRRGRGRRSENEERGKGDMGMSCKLAEGDFCFHSHSRTNTWVRLVHPPYRGFALVVVHGLVTAVGGYDIRYHKDYNKLVSLVDGKWVEQYPPMPTARHYTTAVVASGPKLIVAGGSVGNNIRINTIEVMDVQTKTWHKADNLPLPLSSISLNISGDDLYLVGGFDNRGDATCIASTCKISDLLRSTEEKPQKGPQSKLMGLSLWRQIVDVPTTHTSCVVLEPPGGNGGSISGGHLVAVGGLKSSKRPTGDVYRYDPLTNLWEIAGAMPTPRCCVGVAASPGGGEMMVVGGTNRQMGSADCTNLLEVATF